MTHNESAALRDCRATWSGEVSGLALLYVYAPGRTGTAHGESKKQITQPCQAVFDFAEDGTLLGVEIIAKVGLPWDDDEPLDLGAEAIMNGWAEEAEANG